jgi:hypothetical protein
MESQKKQIKWSFTWTITTYKWYFKKVMKNKPNPIPQAKLLNVWNYTI